MMNGKIHPTENLPPNAEDLLNPFVHRLELSTTYEKIKTGLLTVALVPLRVVLILLLLIMAWLLAVLGLAGLSEKDLRERPIDGWRRGVRRVACNVMRLVFAVGGWSVTTVGSCAPPREAPVLSVAPHSSFMDSLPVVALGAPSIVAKAEVASLPFFGKLINYTQPLYVWRDDPESRQKTVREIVHRATSSLDWPQVLIFPEGTCTNRSCLITFKPGAFYPGVPVQPVCLRYPNKVDTVTWTWEGPGALKLLWLTLTQVHSSCVIEFLPVYRPSEAERADPKLYANNVRKVMARALGVPVSDYTYDDCRLMTRLRLPAAARLLELQRLRARLGFTGTATEEKALKECGEGLSVEQFAHLLSADPNDPHLKQLAGLYQQDSSGIINLREYIFEVLVISTAKKSTDVVRLAFQVFGHNGQMHISELRAALLGALGVVPSPLAQLEVGDGELSYEDYQRLEGGSGDNCKTD